MQAGGIGRIAAIIIAGLIGAYTLTWIRPGAERAAGMGPTP